MSQFDDETRLISLGNNLFEGRINPAWNIGANPNGGYLMAVAAAAIRQQVPAHPDPLSMTVHYLRPGTGGMACKVVAPVIRSGRTLTTARATLSQDGTDRLEVLAAFGDLSDNTAPRLSLPAPTIPAPQDCPMRSGHEQGVALPILDRLEIRLHPDQLRAESGSARVSGWIRFADGRPPDSLAALLFTDAFPPAVFGLTGLLGKIGWVPTIELTVHVRARPAPGWVLGQFTTQDLGSGGRMIEDGALWDSNGRLIAQSRQLALVRQSG